MKDEAQRTHILSELIPISFLIVSVFGLFGKVILSGESLFGSDFVFQFYPWKNFLYETVRDSGSFPLWNPYLFSGTPFIANIQASMFYPLGFLYYLMPTDAAYLYSTLLHFILGALFMYLFVRSLGTSRGGAFLSSLIFVFNGYFTSHLYAGHLSFVQNYVWIPLIFFFVHKFTVLRRLKYALGAGLALGIQILGGFPQIAFYTILGMLIFVFYMGVLIVFRDQDPMGAEIISRSHNLFFMAGGTALVAIVGFCLSAVQLLPTYEFLQLSTRSGGVPYEFAVMDSLPPINLITFFAPELFGNPAKGTFWAGDATWQFWEFCAYIGIVPLLMIIVSMKRILADRVSRFFIFLSLLALVLAFGKFNPIYPLIYRLPGFDSFRIPAQILFLYIFSLSILSGKALDYLREMKLRTTTYKIQVISIVAPVLGIIGWVCLAPETLVDLLLRLVSFPETNGQTLDEIKSIIVMGLVSSCAFALAFSILYYLVQRGRVIRTTHFIYFFVGLSVIDVSLFSLPMIQTVDIQAIHTEGEAVSPLIKGEELGRGMVRGRCTIANAGLWYRFRDVQGYDPLILRRYMEYINRSQHVRPDAGVVNMHYIHNIRNNLIRMLNLKYVVDCERKTIVSIDNPLPRAYVVHRAFEMDRSQVLNFLMSSHFSPMELVVLENGHGLTEWGSPDAHVESVEEVKLSKNATDELEAFVSMKAPGFLILSEIHYPGWRAYVDGKEEPILTGNYLFRTIFLNRGNHVIHFVFNPGSLKAGASVSLACLILTLTALVAGAIPVNKGLKASS